MIHARSFEGRVYGIGYCLSAVACRIHPATPGGGGPTPFLYMATRFLPNVHVRLQKCTKYVFSCLEVAWIDLLAVANLQ